MARNVNVQVNSISCMSTCMTFPFEIVMQTCRRRLGKSHASGDPPTVTYSLMRKVSAARAFGFDDNLYGRTMKIHYFGLHLTLDVFTNVLLQ